MTNYNYTKIDAEQCHFYVIGTVDELPAGERMFLEVDGQAIVVFNIAGSFYAIGDVCTHDEGPLGDGRVEGGEIICPRHGAHFDVKSGKALSLPAVIDTPAYPVRVTDGQLEIGLPAA
jgi:3-phenylpropionate/trans-cinnamate dioxygenase ferredoxin component